MDTCKKEMEDAYLGIDTSCYTTSLLFMDRRGKVLSEARRILQVKPGRCGLQQSEMVYQHTRNLPDLMEQATQGHRFRLLGIGVSSRPRPLVDSYMPAFLAGQGLARSLAALHQVPLWEISHQENHLEAALWSAGGPREKRFLFLHASGGTTDLLLAERDGDHYVLTPVGGSLDLHAGQFVDRVGVALGLPFPAGPALEQLAAQHQTLPELPVAVRGTQASLSGPCTAALRALEQGMAPADLAAGVQYVLAETFTRLIRNGAAQYDVAQVLLAGGVSSNAWIRQHVTEKLAKRRIRAWFAEAKYSCDNPAGCAAYAVRHGEGEA
jgi:N6-L-threonylcarbamoyladenine synthase